MHVRAYHVPEDEMAFHVYEAPTADDARKAAELAGIEPERVVTLIDTETRSGEAHGATPAPTPESVPVSGSEEGQ